MRIDSFLAKETFLYLNNNMKVKYIVPFVAAVFSTSAVVTAMLTSSQDSIRMVANENNPFSLVFSSSNKISSHTGSYSEESSTIRTANNNELTIYSSNVVKYNEGWQSILSGGYFYNPLTNDTYKNKLNGIKSIKYESEGNNSLSLHYGYTINDTQIIYSHEKTLEANTKYNLDDNPTYFYIKNNSNETVDIDRLVIEYTCSESSYPLQNLKILMIGNSFADDTVFYAQRVAASYGINIEIYNSYIASCTIDMHYNNLIQDKNSYSMRSMNGNIWDYRDNKTLNEIINYRTWDVISFQQASAQVGRHDSYSNLTNFVDEVEDRISNSPKLVWYQTWAYDHDYQDYYDYFAYFNNDQLAMYDAIIDCYEQEVEPLGIFNQMIPAGTAVQNMRTSYMKDTFSLDGKHMSLVHGRYLLSVNYISNLFDIDLNMSPCQFIPNEANNSYRNVVIESVQNAYKSPLSITNSVYTTKEASKHDLTNYVEIDAGLVGCSYWNSTDGANYNIRQGHVKDNSNKYVTTERFTSTTLPIGSLVFVDEGFGIRPEAWINDSTQYSRPDETYQNVIEIDNNFWNGYLYRAFNIFKSGKSSLVGQYDQVFNAFHIFVPNEYQSNVKVKGINDKYLQDKSLLADSNYNIDSYQRIELNPIYGFYKCDSYSDLTNSYVDSTAKRFVCSIPFYSKNNDLPKNTLIVIDSGYQWRSDCWKEYGTNTRPGNVSSQITKLGNSFWEGLSRRTFNVSKTITESVNQNAINYMNALRIYVPISEDIYIEPEESKVAMATNGTLEFNAEGVEVFGTSSVDILVTLHGDSVNKASVKINGINLTTTSYSYNESNDSIQATTTGDLYGYYPGVIQGKIYPEEGRISNITINGDFSSLLSNNGEIECREIYFDRCNYSSNEESRQVWQRWYMSGSWTANSGSGDWSTSNDTYLLDNEHSMGMRIANNSYRQTRFTLRNDLGNGSGISCKGISLWLYNPNGSVYSKFRVYGYTQPSITEGDHAYPQSYEMLYERNSINSNEWVYVGITSNIANLYNISLFFETSSSETTYLYLGHLSIY